MSTHRNTWKQSERRIAAYFGTKRTPMSGSSSGHTASDTLHPRLFVEAKLRVKHACITLWDKTKRLASQEKKTPVVILAEKHRPGFWILVHSDDLEEVFNETICSHPDCDLRMGDHRIECT